MPHSTRKKIVEGFVSLRKFLATFAIIPWRGGEIEKRPGIRKTHTLADSQSRKIADLVA